MRESLKISNNAVIVRKAKRNPNFTAKSVLTDSTWRYVEIFLKQAKATEAFFYWEQAHNFFRATQELNLVSKPLTTYYCFLNSTKALLTYKKIKFQNFHGVTGKREAGRWNLQNESITIKTAGILPSFCQYMGEVADGTDKTYHLKEILYNLQYIHRAYCITYSNQAELFIPIKNPRFVQDKGRKQGWFECYLDQKNSNNRTVSKLIGFTRDRYYQSQTPWIIRRNKVFAWDAHRNKPTPKSFRGFKKYHAKIRSQLRYIYGHTDLWYVKRKDLANNIIDRNTLSLTFAAMHRLSEMSRYEPNILRNHLERKASWLLSEFISKSIFQFIDQISSEITGNDFRLTGFRT